MNRKIAIEELMYRLGREYSPHTALNAEEVWIRYRNHQKLKWVTTLLSFAGMFAITGAIGIDWPPWVNMAISVICGSLCYLTMRKGFLSPHESVVAQEWNIIRRAVQRLVAYESLVRASMDDHQLLQRLHTSVYFPACVAGVVQVKRNLNAYRRKSMSGQWWLKRVAKS